MTCAEQLVEQVEVVGGALALNGEHLRCRLPEDSAHLFEELRAHRKEVVALLRERDKIPVVPTGVRLLRWEPKPAPVILTHYAIVTDVPRFISMTLLDLKAALAGKRSLAGHRSARELVDRLEQCGVSVVVSGRDGSGGTH
jgi:hypothetical protein